MIVQQGYIRVFEYEHGDPEFVIPAIADALEHRRTNEGDYSMEIETPHGAHRDYAVQIWTMNCDEAEYCEKLARQTLETCKRIDSFVSRDGKRLRFERAGFVETDGTDEFVCKFSDVEKWMEENR